MEVTVLLQAWLISEVQGLVVFFLSPMLNAKTGHRIPVKAVVAVA